MTVILRSDRHALIQRQGTGIGIAPHKQIFIASIASVALEIVGLGLISLQYLYGVANAISQAENNLERNGNTRDLDYQYR